MPVDEKLLNKVASYRISRLLELAEANAKRNTIFSINLSKRYVWLARMISMHHKIKIPKKSKFKICKKCNNFLIPGINCDVTIASSKHFIVYKCKCGWENHFFYK
ncbi:MAG: ribonuclease P protein component 4 [Candidatus Micrarchaeia archaeon]